MSGELLFLIVLGLLLALLAIGVPVGFALLISGATGIYVLRNLDVAGATTASSAFSTVASFSLIVMPLFILLGYFVKHSDLGEQLFAVLSKFGHRVPGGLALASIFACAGFGAVTGASMTGVATVGPVAVPEMRKHGYSDQLSTGVIAAAGTLGILIPPSLAAVIYGIVTRESIARMLLAGIIPGVVSAILYGGLVIALVRYRKFGRLFGITVDDKRAAEARAAQARVAEHSTVGAGSGGTTTPVSDDEGVESVEDFHWFAPIFKIGLVFIVVMGGIYLGFATVTESAALGAFVGLLILVHASYRSGGLQKVRRTLVESVRQSISASAMLFLLLVGGSVFSAFLLMTGIPMRFANWIASLDMSPTVIMLLILLGFMILGTFLDGFSTMLIAVPLTHPVVTETLGYDPILFGILVIKAIEIGLVTPPVGINAYVISGITKTPVERVFRGLIPFYIVDVLTIFVLFAFPWLVTVIPDLMR